MNISSPHLVVSAALLILLGAGCAATSSGTVSTSPPPAQEAVTNPTPAPTPIVDADGGKETTSSAAREKKEFEAQHKTAGSEGVLAVHGEATYETFSKTKYQAALAAHEPIFLYFYANWCPTCREQEPRNEEVFKSFSSHVHGFRVHTLDNEVSSDDQALAKQFNIYVQHTAIFIDKNGKEIKRTIGTQSNEQLETSLKLIATL